MPDFVMPASFPETKFREFALAARAFFPDLKTFAGWEEMLYDPQEKHRQFDWSWQAVRYRYRSCTECNDEFKTLHANLAEPFKSGWGDEEVMYKLERCIYVFFTSALSVFDSFAFCLYFYGHAIRPCAFQDVAHPRRITRKSAAQAYCAAFPQATITALLAKLPNDSRFSTIDMVRNLVGHRLSGRRSLRASGTTHEDGSHTHRREETWHIPGLAQPLKFEEEMLQRQLDNITSLLAELSSAAREFAVAEKAVRKPATEPQT
jgi:hypothetical protein